MNLKSENIEDLSRIYNYIHSAMDVDSLLNVVNEQVPKSLDAEYCCIGLYDNITQEVYYYKGCFEKRNQDVTFLRAKKGTGIIGWVADNRIGVRIKDAHSDPRFVKEVDEQGGIVAHSILAVPMISRNNLIGVLIAINQKIEDNFSEDHQKLLNIFAGLTATHVDNIRLADENINQMHLTDLGHSIASSAHGLKNILNNMDGGSFIVERGVATKNMDNVNKGWDILKRNSQRIRDIVLDMLLFSRPRKPEYNPTDVNKICQDLFELLNENAKSRNIKIELDLDEQLQRVCIDPKGIYRCILNLVSNAIDACSKSGGIVKISTRCLNNKALEIKVSDNGSGISKENIKHIFDVFYTTKGSLGTGLGLPVTQKIIAEHRGKIDVTSRIRHGTTFTITIPKRHECG
ncbi:MAG TPA: GAF domain-containing protein [Caldithrix sp.]|nr:GAF domain-containing protein [Calditrichaceae bacterium]HEM49581.1 GAF domain-containing protein [Caldithrix sp.]